MTTQEDPTTTLEDPSTTQEHPMTTQEDPATKKENLTTTARDMAIASSDLSSAAYDVFSILNFIFLETSWAQTRAFRCVCVTATGRTPDSQLQSGRGDSEGAERTNSGQEQPC
ncbi:hypothetical protein BaRGS_00022390 [Batillaria attramentaria]|uniref:Uncharacterized protein n=1 Tax=Batillaria attramentaria TaxID=370345 RepID=A0ABD0KGX0_9CAEN